MDIQAASVPILEALAAECDKGYYGPRYVTAHDVVFRLKTTGAERSLSTVTKWLGRLADDDLVNSTARTNRRGGWKVNDRGREVLARLASTAKGV